MRESHNNDGVETSPSSPTPTSLDLHILESKVTTCSMAAEQDDESMVDVPLEVPSEANARGKLRIFERRASEGMVTAFRKLSTQTKVFTKSLSQSLSDGLQSECVSKPEPRTGISERQSQIMSTIIKTLETEELEGGDDDGSVVSERTDTSDFVGAGRTSSSRKESTFRHHLSMEPLLLYSEYDAANVDTGPDMQGDARSGTNSKSPKSVKTVFGTSNA